MPTGYTINAATVLGRWTPAQPQASIPAPAPLAGPYALGDAGLTNRLLETGSNVRLSSLTLTYRLRQTATQDISGWVGARNLFVLTSYRGYDPNVSTGGGTPCGPELGRRARAAHLAAGRARHPVSLFKKSRNRRAGHFV